MRALKAVLNQSFNVGMATPGGCAHSSKINGLNGPTHRHPAIENAAKNRSLPNHTRDTASPQHKRAARAIFDAFTGGEFGALPDQLRANLSRTELDLLAEAVALAITPSRAPLPTDTAWRSIWEASCAEYHRARRRRELA